MRPYMPNLLNALLPLLQQLEREYGMGLPLADLERRCADLVQGKKTPGRSSMTSANCVASAKDLV